MYKHPYSTEVLLRDLNNIPTLYNKNLSTKCSVKLILHLVDVETDV